MNTVLDNDFWIACALGKLSQAFPQQGFPKKFMLDRPPVHPPAAHPFKVPPFSLDQVPYVSAEEPYISDSLLSQCPDPQRAPDRFKTLINVLGNGYRIEAMHPVHLCTTDGSSTLDVILHRVSAQTNNRSGRRPEDYRSYNEMTINHCVYSPSQGTIDELISVPFADAQWGSPQVISTRLDDPKGDHSCYDADRQDELLDEFAGKDPDEVIAWLCEYASAIADEYKRE